MRLFTLLLFACAGDKSYTPVPDDSAAEADTDTDTDSDTDTDAETDDDGDGWSVEEGDCDDGDIYVNPAWDEDTEDGKDNDCDSRTDEAWAGVKVIYTNADGPYELVSINKLGDITDVLEVDESCAPYSMDDGLDGGWVINNGFTYVSVVAESGGCTDLAGWEDDELYVYGVATHPEGYYVATVLEALYGVSSDGTDTELATWNADFSDAAAFELAVYSLAVDPTDGTVGLFDYFGGFATWSPTDGLTIHRKVDLNNHDGLYTFSGAHADGGGWYVMAVDGNTGAYGVYAFDMDSAGWTLQATWTDATWVPSASASVMAIDGDSGDWYVTANAGWYPTVWRVRAADGSVTNLFVAEEEDVEPNRDFAGIIAEYTYGE